MQTRTQSMMEAVVNVVAGYGIAVGAQVIIFPLMGIEVAFSQNIVLGGYMTIISILRSYSLRRFFNWWHQRDLTSPKN